MDEHTNLPQDNDSDTGPRRRAFGLVIAGIIVIAFAIFASQNTETITIEFLWFSGDVPLWLLLVIAAGLGAILASVIGYARRRRRSAN